MQLALLVISLCNLLHIFFCVFVSCALSSSVFFRVPPSLFCFLSLPPWLANNADAPIKRVRTQSFTMRLTHFFYFFSYPIGADWDGNDPKVQYPFNSSVSAVFVRLRIINFLQKMNTNCHENILSTRHNKPCDSWKWIEDCFCTAWECE